MKFIYVVDRDDNLKTKLEDVFQQEKGTRIKKILPENFDKMIKNIPDILIINEDNLENDIIKYCKKVRDDDDNSITPIIVVSSNKSSQHIIDILKNEVELYLEQPVKKEILYYNIKNIIRFMVLAMEMR